MNEAVTLAIPCRADEPDLVGTLESVLIACQHPDLPRGWTAKIVICLNGLRRGQECLPLTVVRDFCTHHGIPIDEMWLEPVLPGEWRDEAGSFHPPILRSRPLAQRMREGALPVQNGALESGAMPAVSPLQACTVLLTERLGKPQAWNAIWQWVTTELVLFCDADVRVDTAAIFALLSRLQRDSHLRLVAAREVPALREEATLWSRMGAIPYRFDFENAGGRLYVIRRNALAGEMPEDLLLEDAWLTVAVGKCWVAKEHRAQVFFLPPATWRDYFAERVRSEGGKLQIRRVHAALLSQGPIAQYRWPQFWRGITLQEYPLVLFALGIRGVARLRAWCALTRKDFYGLYRPFSSTKGWRVGER